MEIKAILLIGGEAGSNSGTSAQTLARTPVALVDVLGKPVVLRVAERLKKQGVTSVAVISESPLPPLSAVARAELAQLSWTEASGAQFWRVAESIFEQLQSGTDEILVMRLGGYAEFDLDSFLQHHIDDRYHHVTRAHLPSGEALDVFLVTAARRNEAAFLFRHQLQQTRSACGSWECRGYWNPLANAHDLRRMAVDGLLRRSELQPVGEQRRPGIWVARGARIHKRARVLAPAFIGERATICAAAVVTRCGVVEHHSEISSGTVIEDATVLPFTRVGASLDISHAVASARCVLHLRRNVEVEVTDSRLLDAVSSSAPLRALENAVSLAAFLPAHFLRGLFARSHREQPAKFPAESTAGALRSVPSGFEASSEASSFPANMAVARRYGNQ